MSEVQQRVYKIFLSCKKDLIINNEPIEKLIDANLKGEGRNLEIECIKRQEDVNSAIHDMECVKENGVYVIDMHTDLNHIAYIQLGYAKGKNMEIIDYYDGQHEKKIRDDVSLLIEHEHSADSKRFFKRISDHIAYKMGVQLSTPKEWDDTRGVIEEEIGGA